MPRSQTTKTIAKRIDLNYFKSANPLLRWKRVLIVIAAGIAAIYLAVNGWNADQRLYNPGPVAAAHANFENSCFECHDSGGPNGFIKTVTDNACLKCHDGPIHHTNQVRLISAGMDRAADCKSCHIEHRGRHALATVANDFCLQCHQDLSKNVAGTTLVAAKISQFKINDHPRFGRELTNSAGKWEDKTIVKFNHKLHMERPEIAANCNMCHSTSDVNPMGKAITSTSQPPPYATGKDRPSDWAKSGEHRYMLPVTYEKHCAACHQITLAPLTTPAPVFAHQSMDLVRAQIASLPTQYGQMLADPAARKKLADAPAAKDEGDWINKQTAALLEELKDPTMDAPGKDELDKALAPAADGKANADELANRVEFYLVNQASNGCKKCHEAKGDVPAIWRGKRLAAKTPAEAEKFELLKTQPTGMTSQPRRWFVHSSFDHDAHRNVGCVECHRDAVDSKATSDVLLTNIESCVECHRPDTSKEKGVTIDCMSCHVFHDRTRERLPTTRPRF